MNNHQQEIMEELWQILLELAGDAIALETFCWSGERCVQEFGPYICNAYVTRMGDYITQHIKDTKQLTDHLLHDSKRIVNR